eukprot:TRINITY_DN18049_c0_g1_i2.p1 TRINITY_DN18049_c0_g1~~TRINITY_DN18049_c0_g1_i2.p1  ORF type:complete len:326 (+),score=56.27 TRINITY_DN18049_c0_g1_i2:35-1012(+)
MSPMAQAGVEVLSTDCSGDAVHATQSFSTGDVVLQDRPFAMLLSDLQRREDVRGTFGGVLKESCAAVVSYQPADPKSYWSALARLSCPELDSVGGHPVCDCIAEVCEFLATAQAGSPLFANWPDASGRFVTRTVLTWMTNGLQTRSGNGTTATALFPLACKVNHSCQPNVRWDPGRCAFLATRAIKPGERLGMEYVAVKGKSAYARCSALYQNYYFWCRCASCERERAWLPASPSASAHHVEFRIAGGLIHGEQSPAHLACLHKLAVSAGLAPSHFLMKKLLALLGPRAPAPQAEAAAVAGAAAAGDERSGAARGGSTICLAELD